MKPEAQAIERFEDAIELFRIADNLNLEIHEIGEVSEGGVGIDQPLLVRSTGISCCIVFDVGYPIWNNENDERELDEDSEDYLETIEDYVRRRTIEHMQMIGKIGVAMSKKSTKGESK